jgi:hypothetical protein
LARAIGWSPRSLRFWWKGQQRIPKLAADRIRTLGRIGPVGVLIRRAVLEIVPEAGPWAAHRVARHAVESLKKSGLLDTDL